MEFDFICGHDIHLKASNTCQIPLWFKKYMYKIACCTNPGVCGVEVWGADGGMGHAVVPLTAGWKGVQRQTITYLFERRHLAAPGGKCISMIISA